jgi:tetratricopeptide (TPR) repeat protein
MPTLGLSMIAKNEGHTLGACLASVGNIVSQIVIADTGSSDETVEVANNFGATVISVPWNHDFAEARNASLRAMETDWVLVLDCDEELDVQAAAALPKLVTRNVGGYLVPIRNYVPTLTGRGWDRVTEPNDRVHPRAKHAPAYFVHENCRLFRRSPEVYFTGRVHELVERRLTALNLKLERANFFIHHFGQLAEQEARAQKAAGYLELLRLKVQDTPEDPLAWVQLGLQEYESSHQAEQALHCFNEALRLQPGSSEAHVFKGMVLVEIGKYREAVEELEQARPSGPSNALRLQLRADALHNLGKLEESCASYLQAIKLSQNDPVLLSKLGYTEVKLGHIQRGLKRLNRATQAAPMLAEVRERAMKACIVLNRVPEAAEQAEELARIDPNPRAYLRAASVWMQVQKKDKAALLIEQGLRLFPHSADLQRALTELA